MHSHLNAIELDHLIEQCQSGELNAADLDPLLVYEMELRINERLAEDQEPLMFTFHEVAYNGFVPEAHSVWVRDRDYVRLFGFLFFTVALILLSLWIFSGGSLFSGKNFQSILNLLFLSIVTFLMLLLVSNKPEDDLEKEDQ
ncbi:hypothetical protein D8882_09000 [Streptococcus sanguinis]|jgi:hypothetical protein|uniref:Uncharacterized protein n=2 Tax=Streptococcus sanguinis TaxID=1305 RepID=A3CKC2_STRSV|nr:hypothetical protein [Streptococcus sanguinis]ABN43627.1 Hypothetical protein SSA_0166 [Streptococcus sanguinis SK36]EGD30496.1 hypothetical protein HMPREF9381_0033 [Streptococcus sanguinis SK72]MBZ2056064.1 hypothetical protein [Streptococcus sanguinis]RSI17263.1 hypothetical protein D8882_09000 [Streptococcus sanguinis]